MKTLKYASNTWQASESAVSIGDSRYLNTRQLTGLAAGTKDTDAVNVAQLKALDTKKADKSELTDIKNNITNVDNSINSLKGGFTIQDANATVGKTDITLGDTPKSAITFKAESVATDGATSALTATVGADKSVTYTLNTKKLKEDLGINKLGAGTMSSWKLKADGDTTSEAIADGNEVNFTVAEANKGLTVVRDGKIIKYGIDAESLIDNINNTTTKKITNVDLSNNDTIKQINQNITNITKNGGDIDTKLGDYAKKDASNIETDKWAAKLGTGAVEENDTNLVTGGTVYNAIKGKADQKDVDAINQSITNITKKDGVIDRKVAAARTKVTVDGEENVTDGNLTIKKTETDGQVTYDLSLNNELVIGKDGKDGKIGLNGKDGVSADIQVKNGRAGVDGKDGKDGITRIVYKDQDGTDHEVATLDDGLKFKGDNDTVITRKLNQQLAITGGISDATELSDNNIGVVGTAGGSMAVKLAKNLKGLQSAEFKDGDKVTNITAGDVTIKDGDTTISLRELGDKITNIDTTIEQKVDAAKITVEGDKKTGVKVTEVKTGDKVTGYKVGLDDTVKVGKVAIDGKGDKGEITGLTNTTLDAEGFATKGRAATEEQLQAAMNKAITGSKTTVKAGDNITVTEDAKTNTYTVALNEDITAKSVTAGKAKISDDGVSYDGKTYIGKDGLNANGKKVTNVAAGTLSKDSTDAVNGSQLFATNENVTANTKNIENNAKQITNLNQNVTKLGGAIGELRDESREGDALNAALSALKPLDFDPLQRSQIMAGVSTYKGKQAVALGLAHYSNEDTLIHGGISYAGSSDLMANLGISWRFGDKDDRDNRKARAERMPQYAAGPISSVYVLQDEVNALQAKNDAAEARIAELETQVRALLARLG